LIENKIVFFYWKNLKSIKVVDPWPTWYGEHYAKGVLPIKIILIGVVYEPQKWSSLSALKNPTSDKKTLANVSFCNPKLWQSP